MSEPSWTERVFGGFRKTSERLSQNLTGVVGTAKLDDATLDDVEDALIVSDLRPAAARRTRDRSAQRLRAGTADARRSPVAADLAS